jgi:hypothetical protein
LIVLNGLFNGNGFHNDAQDLAGLIAVENITHGTTSTSDLGDLLVLNNLFGTHHTGDLAGLIAVDNLFNH